MAFRNSKALRTLGTPKTPVVLLQVRTIERFLPSMRLVNKKDEQNNLRLSFGDSFIFR